MGFIERLAKSMPLTAAGELDWRTVDALLAPLEFSSLREVPQHEAHHGEGSVYAHTQLVCRELFSLGGFWKRSCQDRLALFLAALLHDVGKARTTLLEDGRWTAPRHAPVGARMVREFLWRDAGLAGSPEAQRMRETVCAFVRHHMLPGHLVEREDSCIEARGIAAIGELVPGFDWDALCLLAKADARGRVALDVDDLVERVELCQMAVEDAGCLRGPYSFASACTRRAYLAGRSVAPNVELYDDSWGEVVVMCGLPGTGKDTWVVRHVPGVSVVSLDDLRTQLGVAPGGPQGIVVQAARELAREHLRHHRPFVWNATNLTRDIRAQVVRLAEGYGARARIVFLETSWEELQERNTNRAACERVPRHVIEHMLSRLVPPTLDEAQEVEWHCV